VSDIDDMIKLAFVLVCGADPHRGSAVEGVTEDAWSGIYRRRLRSGVDTLVVTVDLDKTGGVTVVHRAYETQASMIGLRAGCTFDVLCKAMQDAIYARVTDEPTKPNKPRSA
jgi:hypothetical protein